MAADPVKGVDMTRTLALAVAALCLTLPSRTRAADGTTVFIGTYTRGWACPPGNKNTAVCTSKGIYRATFDPKTGALGKPVLAAPSDNPSYLAVHPGGKYLYAVNEVGDYGGEREGGVSAFAIEPSGKLRPINQVSSHGADPCHLSLTASGSHLLVANYSGGNVASYLVGAGGELKEGSTVPNEGTHGPHLNQDAAHAHFIVEGPTAGLIYVADLGLDKVLLYRLDAATGKLAPHAASPFAALPPGSGPRHLAIHPNQKFLYTNAELSTSVAVFARDPASGVLKAPALQTISSIKQPYTKPSNNAGLQISADGRFLYVSNRGPDSITTFAVDETSGTLTTVETVSSGGREPRDFKLDPTGKFLLVGHQNSDDIVVFRIDAKTGKIKPAGRKVRLSKPVNFAFWKAPGT
jgi:6-phosphogluconolactonase